MSRWCGPHVCNAGSRRRSAACSRTRTSAGPMWKAASRSKAERGARRLASYRAVLDLPGVVEHVPGHAANELARRPQALDPARLRDRETQRAGAQRGQHRLAEIDRLERATLDGL